MKAIYSTFLFLLPFQMNSQSTFETIVKASEVVVAGLSIFKLAKHDPNKDSKFIESVCIKNRMVDKIVFTINGESFEGEKIKKELVIQADNKECFLELPKGIYTYEVVLPNKEVFKKVDYKFEEDVVITIKKD
jgi:hypothetical protein